MNVSSDFANLNYDNVAGNYFDKYGSRTPIVRHLMRGFLRAFDELTIRSGAKTAYEVGCGEGMLSLRLLAQGLQVHGSDLDPLIVTEANRRANQLGYGDRFVARNLREISEGEAAADLLVCCEVLEHIPAPAIALDRLAALADRYLLISVPREPLWRVLNMTRGKYLSSLGNTPGHVNHWTPRQFLIDLNQRFDIVRIRKPLPWVMVLCCVRPTSSSQLFR